MNTQQQKHNSTNTTDTYIPAIAKKIEKTSRDKNRGRGSMYAPMKGDSTAATLLILLFTPILIVLCHYCRRRDERRRGERETYPEARTTVGKTSGVYTYNAKHRNERYSVPPCPSPHFLNTTPHSYLSILSLQKNLQLQKTRTNQQHY